MTAHGTRSIAALGLVGWLMACGPGLAESPAVAPPVIPDRSGSIRDHGAKGDGSADDTPAIQATIDAVAAAGGGRVVVPAGRYLSGPLTLRSRIDLHLEKDAVLLMSQRFEDYPKGSNVFLKFIAAEGVEDVRVSGPGTIDGRGKPWWDEFLRLKADKREKEFARPQAIYVSKSRRVALEEFTSVNPPNSHCSFRDCRDLTFRGVTMTAPDESPNTDAINLGRVKNVLVTSCTISTGDDNVAMVSSGDAVAANVTENVTIRDCTFGFGHGVSIGSYTSAGLRDITVENVTFDKTVNGIRIKSEKDRGGEVRNVTYRNLSMAGVRYPIVITSWYPKWPRNPADAQPGTGSSLPCYADILIENVTLTDCKNGPVIYGLPNRPIERVVVRGLKASVLQGGVVFFADATFEGCDIRPEKGPPLQAFGATVRGLEAPGFTGEYKAK
ncbi:MAG: glycoside hydrolase family 28 protein [Planctomycetaceae bacterium]